MAGVTPKEYQNRLLELKKAQEKLAIREYFILGSDSSCMDGDFTAEELRRIADAMDELRKAGDA